MYAHENVFQHIERPFAWLDFDALDENIARVNSLATKPVRIATKSIRSVEVLHYIEERLNKCAGLMTFTAAESVYLLQQGFDHILLGYPSLEAPSIKKLLQFQQQGKNIVFMVDAKEHILLLNELAKEVQTTAKICLDLNVSTDLKLLYFGTKRSPLDSIEKLKALTDTLLQYSHISLVGAMGYEAQLAGVTDYDNAPRSMRTFKKLAMQQLKKHAAKKVPSFRQLAVGHLKAIAPSLFVNGGGSGSIAYTSDAREVTEITVGSAFFAPALFDGYRDLQLKPAAGFALRVTRQYDAQTFVCHGGGYIASGATGKDRSPVFLKAHYHLLPLEGAGEVQTPFYTTKDDVKIGDTVYLRHAKAGELCERFADLHCMRQHQYCGTISTYRGDEQCFL